MTDTNDPTDTFRGEDEGGDLTKPLWEALSTPGAALIGKTVGHYRIIGIIGHGGMGVVFEAEQEQPKRPVALKVINPGATSEQAIRRFEHEAQILGRLQHSGIAQIYEAGTFDLGAGVQPYFAMEFVRGEPLTQYAERNRFSTHARLELMVKICRAVQHAHQKGVIHRDLKPANIMVTDDGEPKILDFGVARATDADIQATTLRTDVGQLVGTIPYMSPEQAGGDPNELDTRSDVYALGVVAYELLAGRLPYRLQQKMIHEAVRIIREEEPTRLSSINRTLRGDVEIVIGKALEKEKDRRYQSALEFASDIERYLNDQPIVARPPSKWYQFRKFSHRNKVLVASAATIFIVLLAGLIGTSTMYIRAESAREETAIERDRAEAEAMRAIAAETEAERRASNLEQVARFQQQQISGIDPLMMGIGVRRSILERFESSLRSDQLDDEEIATAIGKLDRTLVMVNFTDITLEMLDTHMFERTRETIETEFSEQPSVQAQLLMTLGETLRSLGLIDRAVAPLAKAIELNRQEHGEHDRHTLKTVSLMATLLLSLGHVADAGPYARTAFEQYRLLLGEEHSDTLDAQIGLAEWLKVVGQFEEAEALLREVVEIRTRDLGDEHPSTLIALNQLGLLLRWQWRLEEAEPLYRHVLDVRRRLRGDDHRETVTAIANLAVLLGSQEKFDEGEPLYREAMERSRRQLGDEHPDTLIAIGNMAYVVREQGRLEEAEALYRETYETGMGILGSDHPYVMTVSAHLASTLLRQGRPTEAEPYLRAPLDGRRRVLGDEHPDTLNSMYSYARLLQRLGRFEEAEQYALEAVAGYRAMYGDSNEETHVTMKMIIAMYDDWHEHEPAGGHDASAAEWRGLLQNMTDGAAHPSVD